MPLRCRLGPAFLAALLITTPGQAALLPPSTLPGLSPGSARAPVDVSVPPWRAVVRVQTDIGARCTGALVGPRTVITAAHCLLGRGTGRYVRPASAHVLTGYAHGSFAGHSRAAGFQTGAPDPVDPDGRPRPPAPPGTDWAILTLETPLGTPDRRLPLARRIPPPGTAAMLGGFEQDRAEVLVADTACQVVAVVRSGSSVLLHHSCAGTRGVSGAPLLVRDQAGGWSVAAVAIEAEIGTAGGYAIPLETIPLDPDRP